MTTRLCNLLKKTHTNPAEISAIFNNNEQKTVKEIAYIRECPTQGKFPPDCTVNLFFGFFFDGTNNNMQRDVGKYAHSNVARLFNAFPDNGSSKNGEQWKEAAKYPDSCT